MTFWIAVGVVAFGSWYFDHYRKRTRKCNELGALAGVPRMPGESNAAYTDRIAQRFVIPPRSGHR